MELTLKLEFSIISFKVTTVLMDKNKKKVLNLHPRCMKTCTNKTTEVCGRADRSHQIKSLLVLVSSGNWLTVKKNTSNLFNLCKKFCIVENGRGKESPGDAAELQLKSQQVHTESGPYSSTHLRKTMIKALSFHFEKTSQHSFCFLKEKKKLTFLPLCHSCRTWLLVLG